MNDFDAWQEISIEWKEVRRMKKLNQERYDQLFGAIAYIIEYTKKHNIPIDNREAFKRMTDKVHDLMNLIEPSSDENLQGDDKDENRRRLDRTGKGALLT
jgi:glycine/D-amino acid oxidase-like deaminating enzyme